MKYLNLVLMLLISINCAYGYSKTNETIKTPQNVEDPQLKKAKLYDMESLRQILLGTWIQKEYLDELIRTKSPKNAMEKGNGAEHLSFDNSRNDPLAIEIWIGEAFHSMGGCNLITLVNNMPQILYFKDLDESNYIRFEANEDSALYLKISQKEYKYIKSTPIKKLVNHVYSGEYEYIDKNKKHKVILNQDGKIGGLSDYEKYEIDLDWMDCQKFDLLRFTKGRRDDWFIFEYDGTNFLIYEMITNEADLPEAKGKLLYKLTKI